MIKTILLDLGGVLLEVNFDKAFRKLSSELGVPCNQLKEQIFSSGLKDEHDAGKIDSLQFYSKIVVNRQIDFEYFKLIWSDIFTERTDVINHTLELKSDFDICIASNTDPLHYEWFLENYSWFSSLRTKGVSFRLKAIKPEPQFFRRLSEVLAIHFSHAALIDDSLENIQTASMLGIRTHLFTNFKNMRHFLSRTYLEANRGEDYD